ncbi:MAG: hypothetical protein ABIQ95_02595 [Bdellovibrionia bacterium]
MLTLSAIVIQFTLQFALARPTFANPLVNGIAESFQEISAVSEIITQECPPDACVVIGIGRSPSPFIAHLQNQKPGWAWNVPLSSFRYGMSGIKPLSAELEEGLFDHFDRFLPPASELVGRQILLFDFTFSGDSVAATQTYLQKYSDQRNHSLQIKSLALVTYAPSENEFWHPILRYFVEISKKCNLAKLLHKQVFDSVSEFGAFDITKHSSTELQSNPAYFQLKAELSKLALHENFTSDGKLAILHDLDVINLSKQMSGGNGG